MSEDPPLAGPPIADRRPHAFSHHGITVEDPYHWLKDQSYPQVDDPDVLAYLEAENGYFERMMAPRGELVDALFEEIKARQKPDDASVPWRDGHWYYRWRFEEGGQYRIWNRWPADVPDAPVAPGSGAQTVLNEPELAESHEYFRLGALSVSNSGELLAYSTDTDGSERYRLFVKNLKTGEVLEDAIENTLGGAVWVADDSALLYVVVDENWRPYQVRRHVLGQPV